MNKRPTAFAIGLAGALALLRSVPSPAAEAQTASLEALKRLTIEELLSVEITSVSRREEALSGAAAAVAVVTHDDIRRSGAMSVPEALRSVAGLYVGRVNSSDWAMSARGFSSVNSEKLLVLSDTRSIYTPLFSGTEWDVQDYLLADIERIEVIRGPGAALWGSNAVNGVVNITTRSARDTQGLYMEAGTGTEEQVIAAARYGGTVGDSGAFRVFAKYAERDASMSLLSDQQDDRRMGHIGARGDWTLSGADTLTVQGDVYRGDIGQLSPAITILGRPGPPGPLRVRLDGGNVLSRWRHTVSDSSDLQLRFYYDRTHRDDPSYQDDLHTYDLDLQQRIAAGKHEWLLGLSYRMTDNQNRRGEIFALDPQASRDTLISGFVQDQIELRDSLRLTLGTKLEHNDFSGFEVQPSVRMAWDLARDQTLWAAVSRAVRVPTRVERDIAVDVTDPAGNPVVRLLGSPDFESEELLAYELGFRWRLSEKVSADLAAYHNRYQGLSSLEIGDPFVSDVDGRLVIPILNRNLNDAHATGFEALVTYSPLERWRLTASYAFLDLAIDPHGDDLNRGEFYEGATPRHQFGLRSSLDLAKGWQLDAFFRAIGKIESLPDIVDGSGIPEYAELDLRIAWQPGQNTELVLAGQNLLHDKHAEFGTPEARGEFARGVYGKIVVRY